MPYYGANLAPHSLPAHKREGRPEICVLCILMILIMGPVILGCLMFLAIDVTCYLMTGGHASADWACSLSVAAIFLSFFGIALWFVAYRCGS